MRDGDHDFMGLLRLHDPIEIPAAFTGVTLDAVNALAHLRLVIVNESDDVPAGIQPIVSNIANDQLAGVPGAAHEHPLLRFPGG